MEYAKLLVKATKVFKVIVDNGQHLECSGVVNNLTVVIQSHQFHADCYIIPIQGVDMVLEV